MKLKLLLSLFALFVFVFPRHVFADDDFDISTNSIYQIQSNGDTKVVQTVSIKNKKEFVYTPNYIISSGFKDIRSLQARNSDGVINTELKDSADGKSVEMTFPTRTIGTGNVNQFTVSFTTSEIAKNKGTTWDVSIPGLSNPNDFSSYNLQVQIPQSFGEPNIVKPYKKFVGTNYSFSKDEIGKSGVFMIFGDSQYYTFNLSYTITNPQFIPVKTEIALPPPTSYQDVRIKSINPAPLDAYQDPDGNWLAVYNLAPKETKKIVADVIIKVSSGPVFATLSPDTSDTENKKYWDSSDPQIKSLAQNLKTPQAIYDYVVGKLSYSFDKVSSKNERLGALGALSRPDFAVCLEFTDLFVAIARAAGIPARAVEGYSYTDNSRLRPLSLVTDVLHSWPEYYDTKSKKWTMVDPTWGNTTHGMDYFNSLDFDHVAFVVKGASSTYPVPAGGYKVNQNTKDVKVDLGGSDYFFDVRKSTLVADFPTNVISGLPVQGTVTIVNKGNVPIKNKILTVRSDNGEAWDFPTGIILPYGKKEITVNFAKTPFLTSKKMRVTILFDGNELTKYVNIGFFPDINLVLIGGVLIVGSIAVAKVAYKTWSIYISRSK